MRGHIDPPGVAPTGASFHLDGVDLWTMREAGSHGTAPFTTSMTSSASSASCRPRAAGPSARPPPSSACRSASAVGERRRYDVAIVGASIAGCTAARFFAQRGASVALIERKPDPDAYKTV